MTYLLKHICNLGNKKDETLSLSLSNRNIFLNKYVIKIYYKNFVGLFI